MTPTPSLMYVSTTGKVYRIYSMIKSSLASEILLKTLVVGLPSLQRGLFFLFWQSYPRSIDDIRISHVLYIQCWLINQDVQRDLLGGLLYYETPSRLVFVQSTAFQYCIKEEVCYRMSKLITQLTVYQRPGNQFEQPSIVLRWCVARRAFQRRQIKLHMVVLYFPIT